MILTPKKILVMVQLIRQVHFVTRRAKLRRFVEVLEERFLMKLRLRLDQLIVDELENWVF
jgi:hypothetical protein